MLGCLLQQVDANPGGSGEGELAQPRILQDGVRDGVVTTGDDIDDPGGKTGVDEGLGEEQGGQRGGRGRADDHRAASGKSRGDLTGGHGQREVPRGDEQARADGSLGDELEGLAQDLTALTRGGIGPGLLGTDGGVEGVSALVDGSIGDGDE